MVSARRTVVVAGRRHLVRSPIADLFGRQGDVADRQGMSKFQVGDRVRVLADCTAFPGREGTVRPYTPEAGYDTAVAFEVNDAGCAFHDCELELVSEAKKSLSDDAPLELPPTAEDKKAKSKALLSRALDGGCDVRIAPIPDPALAEARVALVNVMLNEAPDLDPISIAIVEAIAAQAIENLKIFASKQADYGPGNIASAGERGVLIRTGDKIARLRHLDRTGGKAKNEATGDSWLDIANYGTIAQVVRAGKWPGCDVRDAIGFRGDERG